jgi:hypothetical protein
VITVPWLPWLAPHEEVPGEVILVLYLILAISCTRGIITGTAMLQELSARTEMAEDDLVFYLHMAMELGMLGGIDIATGGEVTVEHVTAAELAALDLSVN